MNRHLIPLAIFLVLVGFLYVGLGLNPRHVPSTMIEKPAPEFMLPDLFDPTRKVGPSQMKGKVWLLNVWGTWCPECWREHEYLVHLARNEGLPILGVDWRDDPDEAKAMIARLGNPFVGIAFDPQGDAAIDWGVYGAPESFLVDKRGIIRLKHEGAITERYWQETLGPMVRKLEAE